MTVYAGKEGPSKAAEAANAKTKEHKIIIHWMWMKEDCFTGKHEPATAGCL